MSQAQIQKLERRFKFKETFLPDPDPGMSVGEVMSFYSTKYPELAAGTVSEPETTETENGTYLDYEISYSVGSKA